MVFSHQESNDETREWASLHALNLLTEDDVKTYERHLQGCAVCKAEIHSFREVVDEVARAPQSLTPSPFLRERVLASTRPVKAAGAPAKAFPLNSGGLLIANSNEIPWEPSGVPRCWTRLLFEDAVRKYRTSLVRMDAGAVYPAHRHAAVEELYLIEGDLIVEGYSMHPGEYCRAEAGSSHSEVRTDTGCKFIAMASLENEMLA